MLDQIKRLKAKEFKAKFYDERSCLSYLADFKWGNGFICPRCGNTKYCAAGREFSRQCTSCHLTSTPTKGTLFYNVKFPLLTAFNMVYYLTNPRAGIITSTALSLKFGMRQKTCWYFIQKVYKEEEKMLIRRNAKFG